MHRGQALLAVVVGLLAAAMLAAAVVSHGGTATPVLARVGDLLTPQPATLPHMIEVGRPARPDPTTAGHVTRDGNSDGGTLAVTDGAAAPREVPDPDRAPVTVVRAGGSGRR